MISLLFIIFLIISSTTLCQNALVKAGHIIISADKTIANGYLLIKNGKILDVGKGTINFKNIKTYNYEKYYISPGWVDAWSMAGTNHELRELSCAWTPKLSTEDVIDLSEEIWKEYLKNGFTSVFVFPDTGQVCGGKAVLIKTGRKPKIAEKNIALQLSLSKDARIRERPPTSLLGQINLIKNNIKNVSENLPILIYADSNYETWQGARLCEFIGSESILGGPLKHIKLFDFINQNKIKGIVLFLPKKEDPLWMLFRIKRITNNTTFSTGFPYIRPLSFRLSLARCIRAGLKTDKALYAVTYGPSKLFDLDYKIGTLNKGRDADFIVTEGHPLDPSSKIIAVFVEGKLEEHKK